MAIEVVNFDHQKDVSKDIRLALAMCSSRDVKPQTNIAFANMIAYLIHTGSKIGLVQLGIVGGVSESLLSAARQRKLDFAIEGGYTHLAMIDDDMTFPPDTINRLLAHDRDFVCANACQKNPRQVNGVCLKDGERLDSSGKTGLDEVDYGSLAVSPLRLNNVVDVAKPHFEVIWSPVLKNGEGDYVGEDHYFFMKMKQLKDMKFYCDHDLTQDVTHVGDYFYSFPKEEEPHITDITIKTLRPMTAAG